MEPEEPSTTNRKGVKRAAVKSPQRVVEIAPEEQINQEQLAEKQLQIDKQDEELQIPLKKPRQSVKVRTSQYLRKIDFQGRHVGGSGKEGPGVVPHLCSN